MGRISEYSRDRLFRWLLVNAAVVVVLDSVLRFEPWLTSLAIVGLVFIREPGSYKRFYNRLKLQLSGHPTGSNTSCEPDH